MAHSPGQSDLALYDFLRQSDIRSPDARRALAFSRIYSDLARRVLAASASQRSEELDYPPGLTLLPLQAYLHGGPQGLGQRIRATGMPGWPHELADPLADLAEWLAALFEPDDPRRTSLQVWVGGPGQQQIELLGWPTISQAAPALPAPFRALRAVPVERYLSDCAPDAVGLLSHYDVHGLSMMALTLRYLRSLGVSDPDCAMSFEWTGDIGKLWKRAVPKSLAAERGLRAVVMLDCSVHSRKPAHTLRAIARLDANPDTRLIMVDHHPDTFTLAPELQHERLHLVLTDVFSCGLTRLWEAPEQQIMALGAIADKVPEVEAAFPAERYPELHQAVDSYHRLHLHFSPTPREIKALNEYPLRPLWEALADGQAVTMQLGEEKVLALPPAEARAAPAYELVGSVVIVTSQLQLMGRAWYALLEELMDAEQRPYALAVRLLDKRRANFLTLTRWQWTHVPPVRHFIPERHLSQVLGHPAALWADMDKDLAPAFIHDFVEAANAYLGTPSDSAAAIAAIRQNILDAEPVRTELLELPVTSDEDE